MPRKSVEIENVLGRVEGQISDQVLAFWAARGALPETEARRRLPEVTCVLRSEGVLAGVSSAYPAEVGLIGGRRFWIYRNLLDDSVAEYWHELIRATFDALQDRFDGSPGSPIGLCALIADPEQRRSRPDAEWLDPSMIYAGYLQDGRQVRIAYFEDALITPDEPSVLTRSDPLDPRWQLQPGYRIEPFGEQRLAGEREVIELWTGEGGLPDAEARRRVGEVLLVASDPQGQLAGLCTAYLGRNEQLRADFWHYRVFVAAAHRQSNIMMSLTRQAREYLEERFVSGADGRGIGVIYEVENKGLQRHFPEALWYLPGNFQFIGENALGAHVRVHYFPGALAPEPE